MNSKQTRSRSVPKSLKHYLEIKRHYDFVDGIKNDQNLDLDTVEDDRIDTVVPEADPLETLLK